jgi:acyl-CoA thioester hydrolase
MGRIKFEMPSEFIFNTEIDIRISDINYGGHLANDAVLALAHEARLRFLATYNYSEKDVEGLGLIMTSAAITYKNEAFHGDKLTIEIAIDDITRLGFDLFYRIKNEQKKVEIAHIKTSLVFFNYNIHKIAGTPENFFTKFVDQNTL